MIIFVSNDYKTVTQLSIAKMLHNENVDILFFSFNDYWENEIKKEKFKQLRIKFNEIICSYYDDFDINFSINDLIYQDHALRRKNNLIYISQIYRNIFTILKKIKY